MKLLNEWKPAHDGPLVQIAASERCRCELSCREFQETRSWRLRQQEQLKIEQLSHVKP